MSQRQLERPASNAAVPSAAAHFERGTALIRQGRFDLAVEALEQSLVCDPAFAPAVINLAAAYEQLGDLALAESFALRAIGLAPDSPAAWVNLGHALRGGNRHGDAVDAYERAIDLDPDFAHAHWNLAIEYLAAGDYARGWAEYEWRMRSGEVVWDEYPQPRWNGEPLAGKTLLVHAEQGIGDEVLFASCFGDVLRAAECCVLVCDPRLAPLLRRSFPKAAIRGYARRVDRAPCPVAADYQIPAGSLPLHFRPALTAFPQSSFLRADAEQVAFWRRRLRAIGPNIKVGISWQAGGRPSERRKRTARLEDWHALLAMPGIDWINLQYGDASGELAAVRASHGVVIHDWPDADPLIDLDGFAAKLSALDLVISVGNATVHLAGALGVPAWALIPKNPAWRWGRSGERTPWYASVRLFRQQADGWEGVLSEVADILRERVKATPQAEIKQLARATSIETTGPAASPTPPLNLPQFSDHLEHGLALHQAGDIAAAEPIYRQILAHQPRHAQALHLLGVLAGQTGRLELAQSSIRRALAVQPTAAFHKSLADVLLKAGHTDQALHELEKALPLEPTSAELLIQLGKLKHTLGDHCAAVGSFAKAIELQPGNAKPHNGLGAACLAQGQIEQAIHAFEHATSHDPGYAGAWNNLAIALQQAGRHEAALGCLQTAVELEPSLTALFNLGAALHHAGRFAEACQAYRRALEIQPDCPELHNDLGSALQEVGETDAALASFSRAIEVRPNFALARVNRAVLLLELGRFSAGWAEYEWRWQSPEQQGRRLPMQCPAWDGSSLGGKTLLVHCEQGLGDEIMFATCLPDLIARAGHCVVVCDERLSGLMGRSFPQATVHGITRGAEAGWRQPAGLEADWQLAAGSAPAGLRPDPASFPRRERLLLCDPQRLQAWRERLHELGPGLKVGIAWQAGGSANERRRRSTMLEQWLPVFDQLNVQWINLQHGDCEAEINRIELEAGNRIHRWPGTEFYQNIEDLAACIAALDLVISVGNSTVHLAGALGTPVWGLLPFCGGWRWFTGSESPWYASLRLFRQPAPREWRQLFEAVAQEFASLAGSHLHNAKPARPRR